MTVSIFEVATGVAMRSSPTMSAANMAKEAEKTGRKVDVVTLGDLFPKPTKAETTEWQNRLKQDNVANAGDEAYALRPDARTYAYSETTGIPGLRAAAALTVSRDTGLNVVPADIIVGTGGKGALNGAFFNSVKAGDVVLMAAPGWPTNYDMFPPGVKLVELATGDGIIRASVLEEALVKYPNPAVILINAPSNPTGANYTAEEREAFFAVVAAKTQTTIVASDDPYGKLVFDRAPYDIRAVLQRGPQEKALYEAARVAVFRSVSKEYGLAGERVGFVVTKNTDMLISLQRWNENKGGGMGVRNQELAQAALLYGDEFITRTVGELLEKRRMLMEGVAALSYASMNAPMGTIYGWIDFGGLQGKIVPAAVSETGAAYTISTPADMVRYLVYVAGVCPVPGTPFYAAGSPAAAGDWHVRLSFCCEMEQLKRVIANLKVAEAKLDGTQQAA
jgi:aspartate aminotransferase